MALNVQLFVNDVEVDYFYQQDLSVKVFKRYFDVNNLSNRSGDYTLNLKLPKTDRNFRLFNYIGDIQSRDNFFSQQSYTARLVADSSVILKGTLFVDTICLLYTSDAADD